MLVELSKLYMFIIIIIIIIIDRLIGQGVSMSDY